MQVYDLIMLAVLALTGFYGFRRGLAWQVASLAAIVVSYIVAVQFRDVVSVRINAPAPWNTFAAMLILYVVTSFVIWVVFQLVRGFIDQAKLKEFDQQLGALLGLAKGVLLCVIITFFAVTLTKPNARQQIINSKSGYYIAKLLDRADAIMPAELHDLVGPYLDRLDRGLQGADGQQPSDSLEDINLPDNILERLEDSGLMPSESAQRSLRQYDDDVAVPNQQIRELPTATTQETVAPANRQRRYLFDRR